MKLIFYILLPTILLVVQTTSYSLETIFKAHTIVEDDMGNEIRMNGKEAFPGDIIEYTFLISNNGNLSAYSLEPTIPIPEKTKLIPKSISPDNFKVSVDGVNFIDFPVYDINKEEVPESAYKIIKWYIVDLKSKNSIELKLRVRIDS